MGGIARLLAGTAIKGIRMGLIGKIIVGILGGFLGGWLFGELKISVGSSILRSIVAAL